MARITQHPRRRARGLTKGPPRWLWIVGPLVALAVTVGIYAVRQRDSGAPTGLDALSNDPGVAHVHGLGVDPSTDDVYAATHTGLFRITRAGKATRIANRYQDTMGFEVVGSRHFIASGHPDLRENLPPLLGLLESRDAGQTWAKKSLLGEADLHVLRYAHERIYGYDSTGGRLIVSGDGARWETRSTITLRDFAVSPGDPDRMLATTSEGLEQSDDGGETWRTAIGPSAPVLLAWEADRLWLLDAEGRLHASSDGGGSWKARGRALGTPGAFAAAAGKLYAAVEDGIFVSGDGGGSWNLFYKDEGGHR